MVPKVFSVATSPRDASMAKYKSVNIIHHVNRPRPQDKNPVIIS